MVRTLRRFLSRIQEDWGLGVTLPPTLGMMMGMQGMVLEEAEEEGEDEEEATTLTGIQMTLVPIRNLIREFIQRGGGHGSGGPKEQEPWRTLSARLGRWPNN
jgi:hypothetical protein